MFINSLKPYQRELKGFINYVKVSGADIGNLIRLDFKSQLGWYIDYLDKNNMAIVVNRISYRLYFAKSKIVKRKTFQDSELLTIWAEAIIAGFEYLENPF